MSAPAVDQQAHDWFVAHREGWLDPVERAITLLGSTITVVSVTLLLAGVLLLRAHSPKYAVYAVTTTVVACVALFSIKNLVERRRPPQAQFLVDTAGAPGYSFPSGHATLSAALATTFVMLAAARLPQVKAWLLAVLAALYSLAVGLSRLYLGVHWLTDVFAGWALGVLVALGIGWVQRKYSQVRREEEMLCRR